MANEFVLEQVASDVQKAINNALTMDDIFVIKEILGINRFDETKRTDGYYVNPNDGKLASNAAYGATDYIPVTAGEVITYQYGTPTVHAGRTIGTMDFLAAYDAEKSYVSGGRSIKSYTVPDGVAFIRFSGNTMSGKSNVAVVNSAGLLDYEPYEATEKRVLHAESHDDEHIRKIAEEVSAEHTGDGGVTSLDDLPYVVATNAFDKDNTEIEAGQFVWNGSTTANAAYFATGFIDVEPDTDYAFYGSVNTPTVRSVCEYDENKGFLSGKSHGNVETIHTTANTRYLRISCYNGAEQSLTVRKGTLATGYTPRNLYKIPGGMVSQDETVIDAYLPKHIYCAVGRTIELYNNQVCLQADKYHMRWICNVGKALKRKFSITGTDELVGDHTLKLGIYNDRQEEVWAGSTTLHIVANNIASTQYICPIGDSLTNGKYWLREVNELSEDKISFVGTYSAVMNELNGSDASTRKTFYHEGRSGFTAKAYVDGAVYSYGGETKPNVFWDGEKFSWSHYLSTSGIETVNAVQIFLGTNGLSDDNTANAGYIKQMVDAIRAADANIKIFVCNTIYRSNQNGIGVQTGNDGYAAAVGVWKYNEDQKIMDLMKRLDALLDGYTNVYMINLAVSHDSEYNFGLKETPVNPRVSVVTERMPVESVHPQIAGYQQMADIMFGAYCYAWNE